MSDGILPVGTKVMIMSKSSHKYNGAVSTVMSMIEDKNSFCCRHSGKIRTLDLRPHEYAYRLDDIFTKETEYGDREIVFARSSLLVIDDKTDGTSFTEMMSKHLTNLNRSPQTN